MHASHPAPEVPSQPATPHRTAWTWVRWPLVAALTALAFLPIANWIPGGHEADWYQLASDLWVSGSIIVLLAAAVLALAAHRYGAPLAATLRRTVEPAGASDALIGTVLVAVAFAAYALTARAVFSGRPLLIDEVVQLLQARILEQGRLWLPSTGHPELFGTMHLVDHAGRVYGQFPVGGPAFLAAGDALGAAWLVGPVCGAVAVAAFVVFLRATEAGRRTRWLAAALFALAPFTVFQAGSHMTHGFTLAVVLVATAALAHLVRSPGPRPVLALVVGLGYGVAGTLRPTDALAFALPAGLWLLVRAARDRRRVADLVAAGVGVALPLVALLWVNARTTGDPLLFGYQVLWGREHDLGFHRAPWGPVHTPARGLELVNLYLLRLQTYLFESPVPSLVPAIAALALVPALGAFDRLLLASSGLLVGLYFAYWHNGFFLGPRFIYPLTPVIALWTARLPSLVRGRLGRGHAYRFVLSAFAVTAVMALAFQVPGRVRQYRNGLFTMRWDADGAAEAAGVRGALVFVRESWGSQVIARMWALGLSRAETEWLYRGVDVCQLEIAVTAAERAGLRGAGARAALTPLLRDSARVTSTPFSADVSQRYLPGTPYPPPCVAKVRDDAAGFTLLTPLLLARRGGNVFVRDLHAADTAALRLFPGRPIWLLRPDGAEERVVPRFFPVRRDSLARDWGVPLEAIGGP